MKKTIALLLAVICMTCIISTSYAAGSPDFQEATRLNDMQAKKQRGYRIVKFEYQVVSNAWYPPHFETTNSYVIDQNRAIYGID